MWTSPLTSLDGFKYYLVIVDHFTRYTWLYPLKQKSQVKEVFVAFKALVENRFQSRIRTLYSDNGGEFIALRSFLTQHGISHLTTPLHTPEHNGVSERKHRHIVETGLTLLSHASVPKSYWPYAFATAVYLINRMPTEVLHGDSPYAKLFHTTPNYLKLRVFGCVCYPWLRPYRTNKLESRSTPCVFVGYSVTQSAYLCLELQSGRVYTSRHVQFDEVNFPFKSPPVLASPVMDTTGCTETHNSIPIISKPPPIAHSSSPPCSELHPLGPVQPVVAPLSPAPLSSSPSLSPTRTSSSRYVSPVFDNINPHPNDQNSFTAQQNTTSPQGPNYSSPQISNPTPNLNPSSSSSDQTPSPTSTPSPPENSNPTPPPAPPLPIQINHPPPPN